MPADRMPTDRSPSEPGPSRTRDASIDALRGLCLLGIAIVNVPWIGLSPPLPDLVWDETARAAATWPDLLSALFVEVFCEGKFYPQFAALFGVGAGILIARGRLAFARRIAVLLGFGVIHALVGWWGDILVNYALLGLVLLALDRLPTRAVLGASLLLLALTVAVAARFDTWLTPDHTDPATAREHAQYLASQVAIYRDGSFLDCTRARWQELLAFFGPYNWSYRLNTVVMGSFGLWLEKSGTLSALLRGPHLGRVAIVALILGVLLSASLVLYIGHYVLAADVLAVGYGAGALWLAKRPALAAWRDAIVPLGRVAISAYVGQTVAFTLFFYGYGLGMYGRVGPAFGLALACSVWLVEALLARWWLTRFELGPIEWLWRSLTYARWLPILRQRT